MNKFLTKLAKKCGEKAVSEAKRWLDSLDDLEFGGFLIKRDEATLVAVLQMAGYSLFDSLIEDSKRQSLLNNILIVKSLDETFHLPFANVRLTELRSLVHMVVQLTGAMADGGMPVSERPMVIRAFLTELVKNGLQERAMTFKGYFRKTVWDIRLKNMDADGNCAEMQTLLETMKEN